MVASWESAAGLQQLQTAGCQEAEAAARGRVISLLGHRCVLLDVSTVRGVRNTKTHAVRSHEVAASQTSSQCIQLMWDSSVSRSCGSHLEQIFTEQQHHIYGSYRPEAAWGCRGKWKLLLWLAGKSQPPSAVNRRLPLRCGCHLSAPHIKPLCGGAPCAMRQL